MRRISLFLTTALCSIGAVSALSPSARAEIVLMGNDPAGWVFSVDGFLNVFVTNSTSDSGPSKANRTYRNVAYSIGSGSTNSGNGMHVISGFVPETFGFNVKSPDLDGNKLTARLSLQTSVNNPASHNWDGDGASGGNVGLIREAFATYGGSWGEIQGGKSLGIFGGQAIMNDMYIFGVGAGLNSKGQGYNALNTTVGGIGYGYTYAGWNGNVRYTTPAFAGGFKATAGIFEPNTVGSDASNAVSGTKTTVPRFEGGLNWAGKVGSAPTALYANATWQQAGLTGTPTLITGQTYAGNTKNVSIYGGEIGGKVSIGSVDLVAHGYYGEGMGLSGAQLSFDSIDAKGEAKTGYGFYAQAGYNFGQGTTLSARYGASYVDQTAYEKAEGLTSASTVTYTMTSKDMAGVQLRHEINKWVRVVGEYNYLTNNWSDGASQKEQIGAVGVVVTY